MNTMLRGEREKREREEGCGSDAQTASTHGSARKQENKKTREQVQHAHRSTLSGAMSCTCSCSFFSMNRRRLMNTV